MEVIVTIEENTFHRAIGVISGNPSVLYSCLGQSGDTPYIFSIL